MTSGPRAADPRHLDPMPRPDRPPARWRVVWATTLLVAGRMVLAAMVLFALGCRLAFGGEWLDHHESAGNVVMMCAVALIPLWAPLLLPMAHPALLTEEGADLIGRTVLGRRRIRLTAARRRQFTIPMQGAGLTVVSFRTARREPGAHWLIVAKMRMTDDETGFLGWLRELAEGFALLLGSWVLGVVPAALLLWLSGAITP